MTYFIFFSRLGKTETYTGNCVFNIRSTVSCLMHGCSGETCRLQYVRQSGFILKPGYACGHAPIMSQDSPCVLEPHACETKPHLRHSESRHPPWQTWTWPPWPEESTHFHYFSFAGKLPRADNCSEASVAVVTPRAAIPSKFSHNTPLGLACCYH